MTTTGDLIAANAAGEAIIAAAERAAARAAARTGKRANWVIAHAIVDQGAAIEWTVKGAGRLRLTMSKLNEAIRARAAVHGMVQRISDAAAIARDSKTGASATPQEKFDAMRALVEHYETGTSEWARRAEGGGARSGSAGGPSALLREALAIARPEKSAETIAAFVKELKPAQVAALVASEQLKDAIALAREAAQQRLAAQAEGVDAQELLMAL